MKSIEPHSRINPAEDPAAGPEGVVIHPIPLPREEVAGRETPARQRARHRADSKSWPALLDKVLQSWPVTLRVALLLAILLAGLVAIAVAVGIATPLLLVAGGYQARRWLHRGTKG